MRLPTPLLPTFLALAIAACGPSKARPGNSVATGPGGLAVSADPQLIKMDAENTATLLPSESPSQLAVRIRVSAGDLPGGDRPPLNLTLVLDTSGSMEGDAIAALRDAARELVSRMSPHDRISIVVFHSTAELLVEGTLLTDEARDIVDGRLASIQARGTTAMAEGLALAISQAQLGQSIGGIDRIVFLGDGVPNDGAQIPTLIATAQAYRIPITTLGLGLEFDPLMLGKIAMETGGVYRYLDEPEAVAAVFDEELVRMQHTVARNLQLTIQPGPGVIIDEVPGFQVSGALRFAMLGDLSAGEVRDVIIPLQVSGHRDGVSIELLDAVLTFDDAVGNSGAQRRSAYASAKASSDPAKVAASVQVDIEVARDRARAAGTILTVIAIARTGNLEAARLALDAGEAEARSAADEHDDADLRALADQMADLRGHLPELVQAAMAALQPVSGAPSDAPSASPAAEEAVRKAHGTATGVFQPH